nr:saposin-C-like isoform X2 [Megalopta genalis]
MYGCPMCAASIIREVKSNPLSEVTIGGIPLNIDQMFPLSEVPLEVNSTLYCASCEYTLRSIQETSPDNITEAEVKEALQNVFKSLPEIISDECSQCIDSYGEVIVGLLVQGIDPAEGCTKLLLCPTNT